LTCASRCTRWRAAKQLLLYLLWLRLLDMGMLLVVYILTPDRHHVLAV
jgi:hypothetical protein